MHGRIHVGLIAALLATVALCADDAAAQSVDPPQLEVVYLGNEGFLLRTAETAVLVDAIFGDGLFGYDVVADEERRKLEAAAEPYDNVVLAAASHVHGDHFSAPAVARFLQASPGTQFVSSEQAVQKLLRFDSSLADRAHGVSPAEGEQLRHDNETVKLTLFNLHHGGPEIQNLGLLIEICGLTVLHIGDTEASPAEMRTAGLQDLRPDVALLPSWYLRPGRWLEATDEVIRPHRLVAMHLPTSEAPASYFWGDLRSRDDLVRAILDDREGAFVPRTTGESISIPCHEGD